mmetsp:Transcript_23794/g.48672  ORF Transcript_23794/g.48672 Transcript_23794/m.48672 type:complete len:311 (-) Transcript_23794:135-1067(-)
MSRQQLTSWRGWCEVTEESMQWLAARDSKNAMYFTLLIGALGTWVANRDLEPAFSASVALPVLSPARAAWNVAVAALVLSMGYTNLHVMPPPESKDKTDVWHVIAPLGSCSYLTFWSLSIITQYSLWSCLAELACGGYLSYAAVLPSNFVAYGEAVARRVLAACYYASPFAQGWAVTLTLLWLKFNWFEARWQKAVIDYWRARGVPVASIMWWAHLTILAAPLDFLCKNRALLAATAMPLSSCYKFVAALSFYYIAQTNLLFRVNGGHWPYPFLASFSTWTKQAALVSGIAVAICGICTVSRTCITSVGE